MFSKGVHMKQLSAFLMLVSVSFFVSASEKNVDWKKVKDKNGIQVYRAHSENSKFKTFKAVTRIELENIQAFIGA